jgi:hypothetical protein
LVLGGSPPLQISAAQGKDNYVGNGGLPPTSTSG